jgi:hypothetical protein
MAACSRVINWRWHKAHVHAAVHARITRIGRDERRVSDWRRWTPDISRKFGLWLHKHERIITNIRIQATYHAIAAISPPQSVSSGLAIKFLPAAYFSIVKPPALGLKRLGLPILSATNETKNMPFAALRAGDYSPFHLEDSPMTTSANESSSGSRRHLILTLNGGSRGSRRGLCHASRRLLSLSERRDARRLWHRA